jgi:putative heme iron utilization protein
VTPEDNAQIVRQVVAELLRECRSLQMATLNHDSLPEISYTPFLWRDGQLYIFISALARHTRNLNAQPALSVLLIEDEAKANNLFARKRMTLRCEALPIGRGDSLAEPVLAAFERRHGPTIAMLRSLPDFQLFRLAILEGTLVRGFGQAFSLDGALNPVAHLRQG